MANAEQPGAVAVSRQLQAHVRHHDYRGGLYRVILSLTHSGMGGMLGWARIGHFTKCLVCVSCQIFGRFCQGLAGPHFHAQVHDKKV